MDPSIRTLRAVVTLSRTLHFAHAAAELGVSTSTLSEQVAALERQLEEPLFVRTSRSVSLTPLGEVVVARAKSVVEEHQRLRGWLESLKPQSARTVCVGFLAGLDSRLATMVLKQVRTQLPDWTITVREVGFLGAETELRSHQIDVALAPGPVSAGWTDLRGSEIAREDRVVMVARGHDLATRSAVSLTDITAEPLIVATAGKHPASRRWAVDPRPDGSQVIYGPAADTLDEAVQLVAAGLGVNIAAASAVNTVSHPDVCFVPLHGVTPGTVWVLARAGERSLGVLAVENTARDVGKRLGTPAQSARPD